MSQLRMGSMEIIVRRATPSDAPLVADLNRHGQDLHHRAEPELYRATDIQELSRTLVRALRRTELWNGNRERVRDILRWEPERSIIRWAWTQHANYRSAYGAAIEDPAHDHLVFHRFRTHAEADVFVQTLPPHEPL